MLSIQNVSQEAKKAALKEVIEQEAFQANRSNTTIFGSHVQLYGDQQWNAAIEAAVSKVTRNLTHPQYELVTKAILTLKRPTAGQEK